MTEMIFAEFTTSKLEKEKKKEKTKRYNKLYMDIAERVSAMSFAARLQVGCVVVKEGNIISFSWNGTAPGRPNCCEDENNKTLDEVLHAEENAILKLAKSNESAKDACVYITHAPCIKCARMLYVAGVSSVYFKEYYRDTCGLDYLNSVGIKTQQVE